MPLTGDFGPLKALQRSLRELGISQGQAQRDIKASAIGVVKSLLKEQFRSGVGPDGPWTPTVDGALALLSRKLPNAIAGKQTQDGIHFESKLQGKRGDWLIAHQEGHTFPARHSAGGQRLRFDRRGRLVTAKRFYRTVTGAEVAVDANGVKSYVGRTKTGRARFLGHQVKATAHHVGQRVLAIRRIFPIASLPAKWAEAIGQAMVAGMKRWSQRATG